MRRAALLLLLTACGKPSITFVMTEQNNSGQSGTATLVDDGDAIEVSVEILEASVMGLETSHIHTGRCSDVGGIVAGLALSSKDMQLDGGSADIDGGMLHYFEKINVGGDISFQGLLDHNHLINVHDPRDNSLYVSCGEIN